MENPLLQELYQAQEKLRRLVGQSSAKIVLEDLCFPKQLAFITDSSLFATALTSRRAGKTTACALHLLHTALIYSQSVSLYVTLARTNAKKIIWPMLLEMNRELGIRGEPNQSDLSMRFSNGSVIYCSGAATAGEIDRFRGLALKLAYVDEAQSFGTYLEQLINDVLVPACFDNKGQIRLIGTPGPVPVGYFFQSCTDSSWKHHHWTIFDNPWIQIKRGESPQSIIDEEIARRGVTESDPTIQREIFGKWVTDTARLVLDYDPQKNHFDTLPDAIYSHIMGIDLGFKDADAIVILAHSDLSPNTYIVDELVVNKQGLTELFNQVETLRKKYNPYKIVIDTGGLGLKIAEEMRKRYSIPVNAAEKQRKYENIELLNDSLRTGKFYARKSSRFANDSMLLEWDMDKLTPDKRYISDRFHSDVVDAALYAFRESPAYAYHPAPTKPKYGSKEWALEEEEEMERMALEQLQNQNNPFENMWR